MSEAARLDDVSERVGGVLLSPMILTLSFVSPALLRERLPLFGQENILVRRDTRPVVDSRRCPISVSLAMLGPTLSMSDRAAFSPNKL